MKTTTSNAIDLDPAYVQAYIGLAQGFQLPDQIFKGIGGWRFVRCMAHTCKLPPLL
jgi:hypothetical protein